jgi:tRNA (mo5U34)-methyltransferase
MSSDLKHEIERLGPWFHNLHLPGGIQTCPDHVLGDFPSFKWRAIEPSLPADLSGVSVLDIGCNAGFYSFELARRGAVVDAFDVDDHYLAQARWAARQLGLEGRVNFEKRHLYELARSERRWDLVLFLGVFYHLRYPLLGLDIVSHHVERLLVFQSLTTPDSSVEPETLDLGLDERARLDRPGWPKMAFVEHRLAGDDTNWWAPNHAGLEAMLRSSGLSVIARPGHEIYICQPNQSAARGGLDHRDREYLAATRAS